MITFSQIPTLQGYNIERHAVLRDGQPTTWMVYRRENGRYDLENNACERIQGFRSLEQVASHLARAS